ncbi:unnamed protein product [Effrenium voratum]|uniref:Uncharacterized protein n=1 Tax=Effrenium voratum TaxID=2562239 RepID=A0AA36N4Y3_9DINO|nr:unnamed protein product [Effrenium voratum]CAJ1439991.1 unnamed protein product [Effrenium voratum]
MIMPGMFCSNPVSTHGESVENTHPRAHNSSHVSQNCQTNPSEARHTGNDADFCNPDLEPKCRLRKRLALTRIPEKTLIPDLSPNIYTSGHFHSTLISFCRSSNSLVLQEIPATYSWAPM